VNERVRDPEIKRPSGGNPRHDNPMEFTAANPDETTEPLELHVFRGMASHCERKALVFLARPGDHLPRLALLAILVIDILHRSLLDSGATSCYKICGYFPNSALKGGGNERGTPKNS